MINWANVNPFFMRLTNYNHTKFSFESRNLPQKN